MLRTKNRDAGSATLTQAAGEVAELPLGSASEYEPRRSVLLCGMTRAPESDQPVEPPSKDPFGESV